jgi:hypothetical protein
MHTYIHTFPRHLQHYWYQMYLDDLPVWGMVGIVVGTDEELQAMEAAHEHEHQVRDAFIYTSKKFTIAHNSQQIIEGMFVCMFLCICICMYVCMCISECVLYVCMYVCISECVLYV